MRSICYGGLYRAASASHMAIPDYANWTSELQKLSWVPSGFEGATIPDKIAIPEVRMGPSYHDAKRRSDCHVSGVIDKNGGRRAPRVSKPQDAPRARGGFIRRLLARRKRGRAVSGRLKAMTVAGPFWHVNDRLPRRAVRCAGGNAKGASGRIKAIQVSAD